MKQDTICALATPPGGAIAIVRVSGPDAITVTEKIFSKSLEKADGYTLHFGQVADGEGKELDEVLALRCSYSIGDPAITVVQIR